MLVMEASVTVFLVTEIDDLVLYCVKRHPGAQRTVVRFLLKSAREKRKRQIEHDPGVSHSRSRGSRLAAHLTYHRRGCPGGPSRLPVLRCGAPDGMHSQTVAGVCLYGWCNSLCVWSRAFACGD